MSLSPQHVIARRLTVVCWLLLGCPQLLDGEFQTLADDGVGGRLSACRPPGCGTGASDAGGQAGAAGASNGGSGGSEPTGGRSEDDAAAPPGSDASAEVPASPACWAIPLAGARHLEADNCLGVWGWNDGVTDAGSSVTETYVDGKACLRGQVGASGWGVVFNFTFADGAGWNAEALGVGGLELELDGPLLPPTLEVIYSDADRDYCKPVAGTSRIAVPFEAAHPGCDDAASAQTPNPAELEYLRMHWLGEGSGYDFDFCLSLRATP